MSAVHLTHGHTVGRNSRTYRIWANMVSRCTNPRFDAYPYYGGRGIAVCDRWRTFSHFLADMGAAPDGLSLERNDSNGDYELSNCRWATKLEQANNARDNVRLRIGERELTVAQWAREPGAQRAPLIYSRIERGWLPERAVFEKAAYRGQREHEPA